MSIRSLMVNVSTGIGALLISLLVAEFLIIPYALKLPRDTLLMGFVATPGSVVDGQTINAMGFTGDVLEKTKPANTVRVLVLGSSVMFNRHMGERLKQALQQQSPDKKIELLDAALRSHTSRSDLLKLQLLVDYNFDLVIVYEGINDLWANNVPPEAYHDDYRQLGVWYQRSYLLDHSLVWRYTYNAIQMLLQQAAGHHWLNLPRAYQVVFPEQDTMNAASDAARSSYTANINAIITLAQQYQSKVLLMTFAHHIAPGYTRPRFLNNQLGYVNPDNYDSRDIRNWGSPDYVREGLAGLNQSLLQIAQQRHVPLFDAQLVFGSNIALFGDVCHFNDAGVDALTREAAAYIQQHGLLD